MRPAVIIKTSTVVYTSSRWGDYSGAAADPAEQNRIWYTHEHATSSRWSTWIASKKTAILGTDSATISATNGGSVQFSLDNPSQKGKFYMLLGTLSGTTPGFKLGSLTVSINIDTFTTLALSLYTSPVFQGFFGNLDSADNAKATMTLPAVPSLQGQTMYFSFVQDFTTWSFASPAIDVKFVK